MSLTSENSTDASSGHPNLSASPNCPITSSSRGDSESTSTSASDEEYREAWNTGFSKGLAGSTGSGSVAPARLREMWEAEQFRRRGQQEDSWKSAGAATASGEHFGQFVAAGMVEGWFTKDGWWLDGESREGDMDDGRNVPSPSAGSSEVSPVPGEAPEDARADAGTAEAQSRTAPTPKSASSHVSHGTILASIVGLGGFAYLLARQWRAGSSPRSAAG